MKKIKLALIAFLSRDMEKDTLASMVTYWRDRAYKAEQDMRHYEDEMSHLTKINVELAEEFLMGTIRNERAVQIPDGFYSSN